MLSLPYELEAQYLIPALRKELAKVMVSELGLNQSNAARLLGVNKAAVCQYLQGKRGANIRLPADFQKHILKSAKLIEANPKDFFPEIARLISLLKRRGILCRVCLKYNSGVKEICPKKKKKC